MSIKLLGDNKFDFRGLFIFEMANNHQGSLEHGKRIVQEMAAIAKRYSIKAGVKLQFRELDTFVHPEMLESKDNKHIQRFLSTRLSEQEFAELVSEIKAHGLIPICTPFDEPSVDLIKRLGIEILKIGSCSAQDWPLLEKAAQANLPMIVSTGGLSVKETDKLVSFLDHRYVHYALMHCVAIYPTPPVKLQLNNINRMCQRYPHVVIGFSTHEEPTNTSAIQMAYTHGAQIFEKHVGVPTETIKLNAYSATPEQVSAWIEAYKLAVESMGPEEARVIEEQERGDLELLQRGVYVNREIKQGEIIERDHVFFAFPIKPGQLPSGRWQEGLVAEQDYPVNSSVQDKIRPHKLTHKEIIYEAIHEIKGMLNEAGVAVGLDFNVELSHHYGLGRFHEVGTTIIDCINREYCKKILVQLPGQQHPYHHHRKKEETFQVIWGELWSEVEGRKRVLFSGDTMLVQRGVKHRFWSETGAVFEEVSTTHFNDDSMYDDPYIDKMNRSERKTKLVNWGRHQFD